MKVKSTAMILFAAGLFVFARPAEALDAEHTGTAPVRTAFGIQDWFSSASARWQISFPYRTRFANPGITAGTAGNVESELDFEEDDSHVAIVTVAAQLTPLISFDVAYGTASIAGGKGRDIDRFVPNGGTTFEFSESTNELSGDVRLLGITLYYNDGRFADAPRSAWGLLAGFLHYEDNIIMKNGFQTVSELFDTGTPTSTKVPIGPLPGLNSTYDFTWDAVKAGITRAGFLTRRLRYDGMFSVYPFVLYEGKGFWNLRAGNDPTDFRTTPPSFIHESSSGYGHEAALGLSYVLADTFELSAGYKYLRLSVRGGTDTTFFTDGTTAVSNLDWVVVTRQGGYAGMLYRF